MKQSPFAGLWWSPNAIFGYQCLMNFVIGERSRGKTFGMKEHVIRRFLKHGEMFIYLRRYPKELRKIKTFFRDIISENKFPDVDLEVKGKEFYINGELAGYAMWLSTGSYDKSVSFDKVQTIIFDEFIVESKFIHYLDDEPEQLEGFMWTVFRLRSGCKIFMLANAVTLNNPYFIYYKLNIDPTRQGFTHKKKQGIVVELTTDEEFGQAVAQTDMGKLTKDSRYGKMAIENKFMLDTDTFLGKKTSSAKFNFNIFYENIWYGVWSDIDMGLVYVSRQHFNKEGLTFTLTTDDHRPNMMLMKNWRTNPQLSYLMKAFKYSYLRFDNNQTKNAMFEVLSIMGIR